MRFIEGVSYEITIYSSLGFSSFPDFARPGARLTDHPSNCVMFGYSLVLIQQQNSSLYGVKRLPKKIVPSTFSNNVVDISQAIFSHESYWMKRGKHEPVKIMVFWFKFHNNLSTLSSMFMCIIFPNRRHIYYTHILDIYDHFRMDGKQKIIAHRAACSSLPNVHWVSMQGTGDRPIPEPTMAQLSGAYALTGFSELKNLLSRWKVSAFTLFEPQSWNRHVLFALLNIQGPCFFFCVSFLWNIR